ncbi:RrF2 family transcriptional regulator [Candidatus Margulisiibacteriota bacterium]
MRVSTKTRYSLRALTDLAIHSSDGKPVFLKDIAKREAISVKYLENLFFTLKKAGILTSIRGAQGGYLLAKDPKDISILNILEVFEGSLRLVDCEKCLRQSICPTIEIYQDISHKFKSTLSEYSIHTLMDRYIRKKQQAIHYNI